MTTITGLTFITITVQAAVAAPALGMTLPVVLPLLGFLAGDRDRAAVRIQLVAVAPEDEGRTEAGQPPVR